jgi:hypothetical protein
VPAPQCSEKWNLLTEFSSAATDYVRLETVELQAVIMGQPACSDAEIEAARLRKDLAKQAIIDHLKTHHCGSRELKLGAA